MNLPSRFTRRGTHAHHETPPGLGSGISPQEWAKFVLEHLTAQSVVLASGATRVDTTYRIVHIPRVKTDGSAEWFNELDTLNVGDPTRDELVLTRRRWRRSPR